MASFGGAFSDQGASSSHTNAWWRLTGAGARDGRVFWARHGGSKPQKGGRPGTYRFNAGFFDGHVENMDDLTGANPRFWYPKGTVFPNATAEIWADVINKFGIPASSYVVP